MQTLESKLLETAKRHFDAREYQKALTDLNHVIETDDKNIDAFFMLGNIFHLKGEIGKAIKAFSKVVELDSTHTEAAVSLSVLYNDIGKYEKAQAVFEKANNVIKKDSSIVSDPHLNKKFSLKHYELAEMYSSYNRYEEALFEYNKAMGLDPENLEIRIKVAKLYAKKGFQTKAFDELKKLKSEHPRYIPARIALGLMYYAGANIIEAQNEWQNVLTIDSSNADAKMYLQLSQNSATEVQLS